MKERNDVGADRIEVIHLIHPHVIGFVPDLSALEMSLEQGENHLVLLRHVQAQRNFPGQLVILPLAESEMEAPFAVYKAGEVITDGVRNLFDLKQLLAFPADCLHRADCHCLYIQLARKRLAGIKRVPSDTQVFQQIAKFDNYEWFIVTAAVYWGFGCGLRLAANPLP